MFQLLYIGLGIIAFMSIEVGGDADASGTTLGLGRMVFALVCVALLGLVIPLLAVEARRLHDINKSAWLLLLNLIPYVGVVIIYVMMLVKGDKRANDYGPDPKAS